MSPRSRGNNVRKVCRCDWRRWPKCPHSWYFSFKPRGGPRRRFSLDAEMGEHVASKLDAERLATDIRSKINASTFERVADRRLREQREAAAGIRAEAAGTPAPVVTLDSFVAIYLERVAQASGKASWKDDGYLLAAVRSHRSWPALSSLGALPRPPLRRHPTEPRRQAARR